MMTELPETTNSNGRNLWETLAAINLKILWGWFVPPTAVILWILYYWVYQIIVFDMIYSQSLFDKIST
jgi:hypothetical protein